MANIKDVSITFNASPELKLSMEKLSETVNKFKANFEEHGPKVVVVTPCVDKLKAGKLDDGRLALFLPSREWVEFLSLAERSSSFYQPETPERMSALMGLPVIYQPGYCPGKVELPGDIDS